MTPTTPKGAPPAMTARTIKIQARDLRETDRIYQGHLVDTVATVSATDDWVYVTNTTGSVLGFRPDRDLLITRHADYPHTPGYLHDCPVCEATCHCTPGNAECVWTGHNA